MSDHDASPSPASTAADPGPGPGPAHRPPPPPPVPSSDPRLTIIDSEPFSGASAPDDRRGHDLFKLAPSEALQLLSAGVELLVRITGDVPPTPPPKTRTNPQMSNMQVEKENIARSRSEKSLARLRVQAQRQDDEKRRKLAGDRAGAAEAHRASAASIDSFQAFSASMPAQLVAQHAIDGVRLKHDPARHRPGSPPSSQPEPEPYMVVGADSQPLNLQHAAITRKFYSKNEPPVSVGQYLQRLHQFCPMSTAVYLATSLYIHRLAVDERAIPVTRRNAHRLVLAGLRVAMKALEDLSYSHAKMAKVGGVSDAELARLEISFCFLAGFELAVGFELLTRHWETLRDGKVQQMADGLAVPTLRLEKKAREAAPPGL